MKQAEAVRPIAASKPLSGKHLNSEKPTAKKPTGPVTYTVSKGSDVFWSGKTARSA